MLIDESTIRKITQLIKNRMNAVLVYTAGRDQLLPSDLKDLINSGYLTIDSKDESLIEDIYLLIRMGASKQGMPQTVSEFQKRREDFKKTLTSVERYSIQLAKQQIAQGVTKHANVIQSVVQDMVLAGNYEYKNVASAIGDELKLNLIKKEAISKLTTKLRDKSGDLYRDWRRVAITESTNALNLAAADKIIAENKNKNSDQIYVYKSVVMDHLLCDVCRRVYLESDGLTPKVYTLSEIAANGSNVGKKKADWKATVGATHPHCRGKLLHLPDGWGFVVGTQNLRFYGHDFVWYKDKNKIKNGE